MKFKKAIAGSVLGLALGVGVATAGAATAQADPGSYTDDLSSAGFYGDNGEALAIGYAVCDLVAEGYTQGELFDAVWATTDESISVSDAQYIVESAEIFLC